MRKGTLSAIAATISLTGMLSGGIVLSGGPAASAAAISRRPSHPEYHVRWKYHVLWNKPVHPKRREQWRLDIPGIGVATRLLTLGDPDGPALSVPSIAQAGRAAWYDFSAVPGTQGNAVLVGHVDTYTGPAVFYDLYLLRPGDPIYVSIGAKRLHFAVQRVAEVSKPRFPVKQVFGNTTARRLWIITCGGPFDYLTRHYLDNIIVSASYEPSRKPPHKHSHRPARRRQHH